MKDPSIVCLSPAHSEILCELGKENLIIGKTTFCDFPKDLLKEKPIIGSWTKINYELIEKLKPDFVITSNIVQEKIARRLKEAGFSIYHSDPVTLDQIFNDIIEIGKIVNAEFEATRLVENMKSGLKEIKDKTKGRIYKPRVYIEEWHDPPTISGNWIPELVEIAGGDYKLIQAGSRSVQIAIDKLFEYNPEKIIISWCGFGKNVDLIEVLNREGWDSLQAIKNKDVFVIDDSLLNRPGPRIINGAKKLQEILLVKIAA